MTIDNFRNTLINGDCLEVMKDIPDNSIDMILCDLPYGKDVYKWDNIIPIKDLFNEYKRITKINSAIVLTSSQPFTTFLIYNNIDIFKYSLIWEKSKSTGFFDVMFRPMKSHEDICVFSRGGCSNGSINRMIYNPQGLVKLDKPLKRTKKNVSITTRCVTEPKGEQRYTNYPKSVLKFSNDGKTIHPTQKPVALFEYLIKTYTNEGDLVLDNCSGSGTTGIACKNTGRDYILIEKDKEYYEKSKERLKGDE